MTPKFLQRHATLIVVFTVVVFLLPNHVFGLEYVPNELLVEVEPGYRPPLGYNVRRFATSDAREGSEFIELTITDGRSVEEAVALLNTLPRVKQAEPNYLLPLFPNEQEEELYANTPNDTSFSSQWQHNATYGIDSSAAWDFQTGSSDVVIAIIDSGMDMDHPDLAGNLWVNPNETAGDSIDNDAALYTNDYTDDINGWDFSTDTNDPNPTPDGLDDQTPPNGYVDDSVNHGTHVAGIAAAVGNNNEGGSGVVWDAQLMTLQIYDDDNYTTYADIADAINYAYTRGADIINMSFGGDKSDSVLGWGLVETQLDNAASAGVVMFAATGNSSIDLNTTSYYPVCHPDVIGVTASQSNGQIYSGSNYGTDCADIVAPGVSIYSTFYTDDPTYNFTSDYGSYTGTSMASPMAAGLAAMLLSEDNTLSTTAIENILVDTATDRSLGSQYGSGVINAPRALGAVDCVNESDEVTVPSYTYYQDSDSDGAGTSDTYQYTCSSTAPSGYVSNSNDCNDSNNGITSQITYYRDTDGDGLGDSGTTSTQCSTIAPSGYVTNSTDSNDTDYDNDGVSTSSDCNDEDDSVSSNLTYYLDSDGDGLGEPGTGVTACVASAPSGYVTNDDDVAVEIDGDGIDNDGDGTIDEPNTVEENGTNPTYSEYSPTDPDAVASALTSVSSTTDGKVRVVYADGSTYDYTIYSKAAHKLKTVQHKKTGYYAVLNPKGKKVALVNILNGEKVDTQKLSKKKAYSKHFITEKKLRKKKHVVIVSKKKKKVLVTLLKIKKKKGKIARQNRIVLKGNGIKKVKVNKTQAKKNAITIRRKNKKVVRKLRVTKKFKLKIVD